MTTNSAIYGKFGRYPLDINIKMRIIKYFIKLFRDKRSNCILQTVLEELDKTNSSNLWTYKVKELLQRKVISCFSELKYIYNCFS